MMIGPLLIGLLAGGVAGIAAAAAGAGVIVTLLVFVGTANLIALVVLALRLGGAARRSRPLTGMITSRSLRQQPTRSGQE